MADTELKKATAVEQAAGELKEKGEKKDVSNLLSAFGGFNAIRGFMPDADNMNPTRKAQKNVFLTDKRFKDKRESLAKEIKGWLALLIKTSIALQASPMPARPTRRSILRCSSRV